MSSAHDSLPLVIRRQIDDICDRFESAWKAAPAPRLEPYLAEVAEAGRAALLPKLVQLDIEYRCQRGESPHSGEYLRRFPALDVNWLIQLLPPATVKPAKTPPVQGNDRNLLFGILALQMDFITRDTLVGAMNAWVLSKEKPLGLVLVERGALAADDQKLLDALVNKHIERHGNDPEQSLASIDSLGSLQNELAQIADPDLQSSLIHVSGSRRVQMHADTTECEKAGAPNAAGSRFRIVRPHAEGGLGRVLVAQDEELHREVALKEIKDKYADDPESRSRFVHEAEITGGLEHPGIVPVYSLGQYEGGRPFYAMRFIKGESLKEAIDRYHRDKEGEAGARDVVFRQLLTRFIAVCGTIAYAHSRGVLHRDIKPGNIMLGKYGETVVVDWGLAKVIGRSEIFQDAEKTVRPPSQDDITPTQMGAAFGTLAYMAPEQAAGRLDQMGPTSDVYSLGATLYVLLTGKTPVKGSTKTEILENVRSGNFAPPRQIHKQTPAGLEAICMKAMALKPTDRYATALALGADIENWLADQPVKAWREPLRARAARWLRRHRPLVAGGVALLVTAVIALAISTVVVSEHRDAAEAARGRALESLDLLTDVAEEMLPNTPQMEKKQEETLKQALQLRERLLRDRVTDRAMQKKLARDHQRLANVWYRLGELDKAADHYRLAIHLFEKSGASEPEDRYRLAICHNDFGDMLARTNNKEEAEKHFEQSKHLHSLLAQVPAYQLEAARTYNNLGILKAENGEHEAAKKDYDEALGRLLKLERDEPANRDYPADVGRVQVNLGVLYETTRQNKEAVRSYTSAIERLERLRKTYPTKYANLFKLAMAYNNLGQLVLDHDAGADRFDKAGKYLREAVELFERLTIDFPRNHLYRMGLGRGLYNLGNWHLDKKDLAQAEQTLLRANDCWDKLEQNPASRATPEIKSLHGATLENLAVAAYSKKDYARACILVKEAIRTQEQARQINPHADLYRVRLGQHFEKLIIIAIRMKDAAQADAAATDLSALGAANAERSYQTACFLARRVELASKTGLPDLAESLTGKAVVLLEKALKDGYKKNDDLNKDANLDFLRAHPAFQRMLASVKKEEKE